MTTIGAYSGQSWNTGGFAVLLASGGSEAIELARAFRPSLVLLDLMMPEMDGWQTLDAMRADPVLVKLPVVAVTADVHVDRADLQRAGFRAYISKPILPSHLLDAVRRCIAAVEAGGAGWLDLPGYTAAES